MEAVPIVSGLENQVGGHCEDPREHGLSTRLVRVRGSGRVSRGRGSGFPSRLGPDGVRLLLHPL